MTGLSEVENRFQEELARKTENLQSKNPTGTPSVPTPGQVSIFVEQTAHGLTRGQAAYLPSSSSDWIPLENSGPGNWTTPGAIVLWGIVDRARLNSFTIVVSGVAVIPGASLTPGAPYLFSAGVPVILNDQTNRQVPQMLLAQAIDATHVFVQSCPAVQNPYTQDTVYRHIVLPNALGAVVGDFVAVDNSNSYILALADATHPEKANVLGCIVYDLGDSTGSAEQFLLAEEGDADIDQGTNLSSSWPTSSGHPTRYLSTTTPGKTVDTAPSYPVLVCYGKVTYDAGTGRSTGTLRLAGPGRTDPLKIPIDLAHGGTGVDFTSPAIPANAVVVANGTATALTSVLNASASAFLTQGSGGAATWTFLDTGIFQISSSTLKLVDGSVLGQFLRWSGTAWTVYGPLMSTKGQLLSHDGTDLVTLDASTALSVVGNPTNAAAVPITVAAASADTVLGRRGTTLTWAKVARAEMVDGTACSVLGRSANSSGVLADIAAASDGLYLTRSGGVLVWAALQKFNPQAYFQTPGTTSWTVPAGVYRVRVRLVGAGGGKNSTAYTFGAISGINFYAEAGGAGGGAIVIQEFDTVPGDTITVVVGGGVANADGQDTGITYGSFAPTAGGGKVGGASSTGAPGQGGNGGRAVPYIDSSKNTSGYGIDGPNGVNGRLLGSAPGGTPNPPGWAVDSISSVTTGGLGAGAPTVTAGWAASTGSNGAVIFEY